MRNKITLLIVFVLSAFALNAQDDPYVSLEIPAQNMLKFNRFMVNPTFSTVRENKSYINLYHRNQWIQYDSSFNTYLLSYSGRVGDKMGLGLSLYHQSFGAISNFGVLANYATGIRLAEKSVLTLGFNLSYYKSGYDQSNAITATPDPRLVALEGNSLLSVQPGINLAVGAFDFGVYAENLIDYNLKTNESITSFSEKTFSGHIQYTKPLESTGNFMEGGRLMLMARGRTQPETDFNLSGNLLWDLPKIGWLQTGYDDYYGISAGVGFNLSQRISLGYTFEKGIKDAVKNLGPTHEISFAYSFEPKLTDKMVFLNEDGGPIVQKFELELENSSKTAELDIEENENIYTQRSNGNGNSDNEIKEESSVDKYKAFSKKQRDILLAKDVEIAQLKARVNENSDIINELLFIQDSLDNARTADLERRFAHLMTFIRRGAKNSQVAVNEYDENGNLRKITENTAQQNIIVAKPIVKKTSEIAKITINKSEEGFNKEEKKSLQSMNSELDTLQNKIAENRLIAETLIIEQDSINTAMAAQIENNFKELFESAREKEKTSYASSDVSTLYMNEPETTENKTLTKEEVIQNETPKNEAYTNELKKNKIKSSTLNNLSGVESGYYIIANVFSTDLYFDKFMINLNNKELSPKFFVNPKNHWKYVYLKRFDSWQEAIAAYKSNMNGGYIGDMWIMDVNVNHFNTDETAIDAKTNLYSNEKSNESQKDLSSKTVSLQTIEERIIKEMTESSENISTENQTIEEKDELSSEFKEALNKNKIKNGTLHNLKGVAGGYYIIANVFSTDEYFNKFMAKLKTNGIEANYFETPKNKLKYVYLKRLETWQEAIKAYKSQMEGTYKDTIWIMNVLNKQENPQILKNIQEEKVKSPKKSSVDVENNVKSFTSIKKTSYLKNNTLTDKNTLAMAEEASQKAYQLALKTNNIKSGTLKNLKGVESGYYMIVNVYGTYIYFERFFDKLSKKGLNPNYFINDRNNWKYVFLKRFDTWQEAVAAYKSNVNNTYPEEKWIMNVDNRNTNIYYPTNKPIKETEPNHLAKSNDKNQNNNIKPISNLKSNHLALLN